MAGRFVFRGGVYIWPFPGTAWFWLRLSSPVLRVLIWFTADLQDFQRRCWIPSRAQMSKLLCSYLFEIELDPNSRILAF